MIGLAVKRGVVACAALLVSAALSTPASAQKNEGKAPADTATCGVFEIEAKNDKPGIDKQLKPLEKKLKKPPFSSWKTFRLLKKHNKKLAKMKAQSIDLHTGGKMSLLYRDKTGGQEKKVRLRLTVQMDDSDGKRKLNSTLKIDSGDYSLIGGEELDSGGTYIVAITCSAKP